MTTANFYQPQSQSSVNQYGYWPGNTYLINGYRMYLSDTGYFYFVDHPDWTPLRAGRRHYRTGGIPGIIFKWLGVLSLIPGIGLMFVEDNFGLVAFGAILIFVGFLGTGLALVDSIRNHPTAWKVGATVAVAGYLIHSLGDDD